MERKQIYRGLWLVTISLLLVLFIYHSALSGPCLSPTAGNVGNSGTVSGVGSGSVGTQVGIKDNTTVGGTDQGKPSSGVQTAGPVKGSGPGTGKPGSEGYNPLDDPNRGDRGKPVDTAKVDQISSDFQKGQQPGGKGTKGSQDQTGIQQPDSYTQGGKPTSGTTSTGDTPQPPYPPYPPQQGSETDPGKAASDYVKNLPPPKDSGSKDSPGKTTGTTGKTTSGATTAGIDVKVVGTAPAGKCNIVNGQLVPVEKWPVKIAGMTLTLTGPVNQTAKSSAGGTFSFKEIPAGDYVIAVNEWNYGMTKQNFTAPSGKAIQITLKGSCPYLYVWTGEEFERENDIYSVARVLPHELLTNEGREIASREGLFLQQVSLENLSDQLKKERSYRDYYRINKSLKVDAEGNYRLKIREQASERSFTDVLELWVVDHRPGLQTGATRSGKLFFYEGLKFLESLSLGKGGTGLYDGEAIEVTLPEEAFSSGLLAVEWQGFQQSEGKGQAASLGRPRLSLQRRDPNGIWQTVDWVYPRDEIERVFFMLEDLGRGWDDGGKIRLVATSCDVEKYHRIDRIAWGKRLEETPAGASLALISAVKSGGEDVRKQLLLADGESVFLGPEEEVNLRFQSGPLEKSLERTFIFVSEGFYIPAPMIRLAVAE